jgi:hypothetical protein
MDLANLFGKTGVALATRADIQIHDSSLMTCRLAYSPSAF